MVIDVVGLRWIHTVMVICICLYAQMSGSRAGSTSSKMEKRKITLTTKALASKIELIQKQRKEEVNKLKSQLLSLKELMGDDQNASQVKAQFDVLLQASEKATALHKSLMPLIPSDEQDRQDAWFVSIIEYNQGFINDAKAWISEVSRPYSELTHDVECHQEVLSGE